MDKKNTLLLTVIAIATLLVAVVGATFAYFSAQTGAGAEANINVTTHTTDTATFSTFDDINIKATLENFGKEDGSLVDATKGYVSFKPSDDTKGNAYYCYNAYIEISKNDFIYSLPKTFGEEGHNANYPELVLNIWKKQNADNGNLSEDLETPFSENELYNKEIIVDDQSRKLTYYETILNNNKICQADNDQTCENSQKVSGYDITVVNNSSVVDSPLKDIVRINIPANRSASGEYSADDYVHKITATGGETVKAAYDLWKVQVTLVNYLDTDIYDSGSGDQSKYDYDRNENIGNAGRTFNATLHFVPLADQEQCTAEKYEFE